jgi:hypothetical protein
MTIYAQCCLKKLNVEDCDYFTWSYSKKGNQPSFTYSIVVSNSLN